MSPIKLFDPLAPVPRPIKYDRLTWH